MRGSDQHSFGGRTAFQLIVPTFVATLLLAGVATPVVASHVDCASGGGSQGTFGEEVFQQVCVIANADGSCDVEMLWRYETDKLPNEYRYSWSGGWETTSHTHSEGGEVTNFLANPLNNPWREKRSWSDVGDSVTAWVDDVYMNSQVTVGYAFDNSDHQVSC